MSNPHQVLIDELDRVASQPLTMVDIQTTSDLVSLIQRAAEALKAWPFYWLSFEEWCAEVDEEFAAALQKREAGSNAQT
jgi:hypothetical protein